MGNEASSEASGAAAGGSSLVQELLRLKAAKTAGWMSEEEFNVEMKRVIREWTGETREPAYDMGAESAFDVIGDAAQMQEWEARYGRTGNTPADTPERWTHEAAGQRAEEEDGMVELDLFGGGSSPSKTAHVEQQLLFEGAVVHDLSESEGAATHAAHTGGEAATAEQEEQGGGAATDVEEPGEGAAPAAEEQGREEGEEEGEVEAKEEGGGGAVVHATVTVAEGGGEEGEEEEGGEKEGSDEEEGGEEEEEGEEEEGEELLETPRLAPPSDSFGRSPSWEEV